MAERNAQFLQIGLGHIGQYLEIDGILGKGSRVLGEPDPIKPASYMVIDAHCRVLFPPNVCFSLRIASAPIGMPTGMARFDSQHLFDILHRLCDIF